MVSQKMRRVLDKIQPMTKCPEALIPPFLGSSPTEIKCKQLKRIFIEGFLFFFKITYIFVLQPPLKEVAKTREAKEEDNGTEDTGYDSG